jgi:uncharacterized damage-inducible protein DinB
MIAASILGELEHEAATTRKLLERAPENQFDWKPHQKSMTLGRLASHCAETFTWLDVIVNQDVFEMDPGSYTPFQAGSQSELLEAFDANVESAKEIIRGQSDESLLKNWQMKTGGEVTIEMPRIAVIRGFVLNHLVHHRGQLSVYLRLNDIPVPSIYGPSADEAG